MSPESKRRLLRYGIAVDLVIVITGVAMLLPRIPAAVVVALYAIAAALSAVKGGWQGGLAATGGGLIALVAAFHDAVPLTHTATFVAAGAAISAIAAMLPKRAVAPLRAATAPDAPPLASVVAFPEEERVEPPRPSVNLRPKTLGDTAMRTPPLPQKGGRRPRVLLLEKRRGTADTILPKLRQRGVEAEVVERWIDAVDELFRFRPDAFFLDSELPDFDKVYKAVTEHSPSLPIVLTSKQNGALPAVRHAATMTRPYDADALVVLARTAFEHPDDLRAQQAVPVAEADAAASGYRVTCFNCRVPFDAFEADWCSCLTKERTLVCTNCLMCFCKAPPSYQEKFRIGAPPRLLERPRQAQAAGSNPPPEQVRRPLVMLVENDDEINVIVQRVCTNLGYGFVSANDGEAGLTLARAYRPNLILSDAFLAKREGREMCRILKEEPGGAACKMVVMTGVYVDTKYKSEALQRFRIDDCVSKPVSITDLINLLQRHLEGVTGLPAQEDLHALHRRDLRDERVLPYEICCFTCNRMFDASSAEWCPCVGRDNTLVCPHCNHCFCNAPPAYRERFWIDASPALFERKIIRSTRAVAAERKRQPTDVKRPLILLVEDDENVQLIVETVVTTMNYGLIVANDREEALALARQYDPELILSDAVSRQISRLTSRAKEILMTGLYAEPKARTEALSHFDVDDYLPKPLAVEDLIKSLKKHLPQDLQPTM